MRQIRNTSTGFVVTASAAYGAPLAGISIFSNDDLCHPGVNLSTSAPACSNAVVTHERHRWHGPHRVQDFVEPHDSPGPEMVEPGDGAPGGSARVCRRRASKRWS